MDRPVFITIQLNCTILVHDNYESTIASCCAITAHVPKKGTLPGSQEYEDWIHQTFVDGYTSDFEDHERYLTQEELLKKGDLIDPEIMREVLDQSGPFSNDDSDEDSSADDEDEAPVYFADSTM